MKNQAEFGIKENDMKKSNGKRKEGSLEREPPIHSTSRTKTLPMNSKNTNKAAAEKPKLHIQNIEVQVTDIPFKVNSSLEIPGYHSLSHSMNRLDLKHLHLKSVMQSKKLKSSWIQIALEKQRKPKDKSK